MATQVTQEAFERLQQDNEGLVAQKKVLEQEVIFLKQEIASLKKPEEAKPAGPPPPFKVSGKIGGPFSIDGTGFGSHPGILIVQDRTIPPGRWKDHSIKGILPPDLKTSKDGTIDVTVNGTLVKAKL